MKLMLVDASGLVGQQVLRQSLTDPAVSRVVALTRPSLLDGGPRPDSRRGEAIALVVARMLRPLLPARYRAVATDAVARTLLTAALKAAPGAHVVESERIA